MARSGKVMAVILVLWLSFWALWFFGVLPAEEIRGLPQGQKLTVSIYSYKDTYEVLNRDLEGNVKIYKIWKGEKLPSSLYPDVKIRALENIMGEIIIRKKFIDD